jgi:hypothetical protein
MNAFLPRSGSKIILTKEFSTPARNKWSTARTFPKNLVLSLNSLKINRVGTTFMFNVIKAKPVREKYYKDFDLSKVYPNIRLRDTDAQLFIEEAEYRSFDEEYLELTQ